MQLKKKFEVVKNKYKDHPEFIGIDISNPNQRGAVDDTLLHLVSRKGDIEGIEILIDYGAQVNIIGDLGNTPLHQAAMMGQINSVRALLKRGANPNIKNEFGQTAKEVAVIGGHVDIVNIFGK